MFWAIVGTCVGLFVVGAVSLLISRPPRETLMSNGRLLRVVGLETLLLLAWVPVLRRRGWSLRSLTRAPEIVDPARAVWLLAAVYVAYVLIFTVAALAVPGFQERARSFRIGGAPSWWTVALVSIVNPIAEECLYLGFITNVVKRDGFPAALLAGILARAAIHVYQGPAGIVLGVAMGLVFGAYYLGSGRLWPLVMAHALADLVALGRLADAAG